MLCISFATAFIISKINIKIKFCILLKTKRVTCNETLGHLCTTSIVKESQNTLHDLHGSMFIP